MNITDLHPSDGSKTRSKRLGRGHGSGRGKTSGRGTKGQKARTGAKVHRAFNGGQTRLSKRLPFLRGVGNSNQHFKTTYALVNIEQLNNFKDGDTITLDNLIQKGILSPTEAREYIKILGNGTLKRKLTVAAHKFSEVSRTKIEEAGGQATILSLHSAHSIQ